VRDFQLKVNQKLFVGRVLPGTAGGAHNSSADSLAGYGEETLRQGRYTKK